MNWLARLKKIETGTETETTKPTKGGSVGFVGTVSTFAHKREGDAQASNDPVLDPDRLCWPYTQAMNTAEIDTFMGRLAVFTHRGLCMADAEMLADRLVVRDRRLDEMRTCSECRHLRSSDPWYCGSGASDVGNKTRLSAEWIVRLHRCPGYSGGPL